jgi:methylthioribose-1-phosphate isomerase
MPVPTISFENGEIRIIDQTKLPLHKVFTEICSKEEMWEAIRALKIRGAPAIGIAAAFGVYLGIRDFDGKSSEKLLAELERVCDFMASSRPTAVNLFWAIDRMRTLAEKHRDLPVEKLKDSLLQEAVDMIEEDNRICRAIGEHGLGLIKDGFSILTHCNAGGLATAMYGTALAPLFRAHEKGLKIHVYVDETRPLLQGARITSWELLEAGISTTLITDNMAAFTMSQGRVDLVIVGADRIAANGDTANKIGTLGVAVLAREFGIPFYVAAPLSTIDMQTKEGADIPIEERSAEEVTRGFGTQTAPDTVQVYNPAFDVTPAEYISGIITERGVISPPSVLTIREIMHT